MKSSDHSIIPSTPRKIITSSAIGVSVICFMAAAIFLLNFDAIATAKSSPRPGPHDSKPLGLDIFPTHFSWPHSPAPKPVEKLLPGRLGDHRRELFMCDRSHPRTDVCYMKGDVRMMPKDSSFRLYARNESTSLGEERIKPYTRKWEEHTVQIIHELKLTSVRTVSSSDRNMSECDVVHSVPGVVFTTGGYTGNVYHEFHDGLIPLFITSQHLKGEVVLIAVEFHNWWFSKYSDVVSQLSNYPIIDFDTEHRVHCFPEVTLGLHIHDEMTVDPSLMPHNESIVDFRRLLDRAYTSRKSELHRGNETSIPLNTPSVPILPPRPRMTIIVRNDSRVILNLDDLVKTASKVGFEVSVFQPERTTPLKDLYRLLNSSHVMLGVHGAAMTHFVFMRPGTVFIQVIPLGTKWAASAYYGEPAVKLGLKYLGYEIKAEESSLVELYDRNSDILNHPDEVASRGWDVVKKVYLDGQNVRLSMSRFKWTLLAAKGKALKAMSKLGR